jgi:uncharacterized protein (DUF2147 family)
MVKWTLVLALAVTLAHVAAAQAPSPLLGNWRSEDGSTSVRIAPCPNRVSLCGTVTADRPENGEPSLVNQMVLRDVQLQRNNEWRGNYVADGQTLRTRIRMPSQNRAIFRVCAMALLCDTIAFNRQ